MADTLKRFGINPDQSPAQLKKAWHQVALSIHPDHGGAKEAWLEAKTDFDEAIKAAKEAPCPVCGGKGQLAKGKGFSKILMPCGVCEESGKKWAG